MYVFHIYGSKRDICRHFLAIFFALNLAVQVCSRLADSVIWIVRDVGRWVSVNAHEARIFLTPQLFSKLTHIQFCFYFLWAKRLPQVLLWRLWLVYYLIKIWYKDLALFMFLVWVLDWADGYSTQWVL